MAGEFKGDFTRDSFDVRKHFSRVFLQQGRVLLDADWNEQVAILLRMLRKLGADHTGAFASVDFGFYLAELGVKSGSTPTTDFIIVPGACYVDGILCSCDGKKVPFYTEDKAANVTAIRFSEWMPDGLAFQDQQYVAILDDAKTFDPALGFPIVSLLTQTDPVKRSAVLSPAAKNLAFADAPGFVVQRLTTYLTQPDYPLGADAVKNFTSNWKIKGKTGLAYLDVWERHIAYFQEPSIREIALEGRDTASRAKVVAQVRIAEDFDPAVLGNAAKPDLAAARDWLTSKFQPYNRGWLAAQLKPPSNSSPLDPCMTHPDARYRGAENQLYRVEIHNDSSDGAPSFKWSRENACVAFPIVTLQGSTVFLESLGRDSRFALKSEDWVELLDDNLILLGKPGQLFQLDTISLPDRSVTLKAAASVTAPAILKNDPSHPHAFLRRWDQQAGTSDGIAISEVSATSANWFDLEDGIQVQFQTAQSPGLVKNNQQSAPANFYRTGDYWLIPARTARNGVIDWPSAVDGNKDEVAIAVPPHGVNHHYAPLATIDAVGDGAIEISKQLIATLP